MARMKEERIDKIAELVDLDLSSEEKEKLASMFSETLDYIEILSQLDTSNVTETFQVTGKVNEFMKGEDNEATLAQNDALSNAGEVMEGKFVTEAVFDR